MSNLPRRGTRADITAGSRWVSRDPRDDGRTVTIDEVDGDPTVPGSNGFVKVSTSARRSTMRTHTLLTRYDLAAPGAPW